MWWASRALVAAALLCITGVAIGASPGILDFPSQSAYLSEVTSANYERLPPNDKALLFRWDFSTGKAYTYNLEQIVDSTSSFSKVDREAPTRMTSEGVIDIKSQVNGTAKVVLRDMTTTMQSTEKEAPPEPIEHHNQPVVVQGMREDGTFGEGKAQQDALFRFMLPLPTQPLTIGETTTIPFRFPVNVMGSPLDAKGTMSVTFSSLVYVRGHQCAQLESDIRVEDLDLPEEITTTFHVGVSGRGRYFFEIDERRLLEATIAVVISMEASFPSLGGPESPDEDEATQMSMFSDTLIRLTSD